MICNRIITGASFDVAAADTLSNQLSMVFGLFLISLFKKNNYSKIDSYNVGFLNSSSVGIYLAVIYTVGHIFIAMTCNRLLTGAPLNLAAIDALVEPLVNGFWFYLLFEVFNKYKNNI